MERQYDNIFKRHSTRMYNMEPLDKKSLDKLKISFGLNSRRVLGAYRRKGRIIFINAP